MTARPAAAKVPKAAMPAVRLIRKLVPRPKELPVSSPHANGSLRWGSIWLCPIGLLMNVVGGCTPIYNTNEEFAFVDWWDAQTDPRAAVEAVWPRKRRRRA